MIQPQSLKLINSSSFKKAYGALKPSLPWISLIVLSVVLAQSVEASSIVDMSTNTKNLFKNHIFKSGSLIALVVGTIIAAFKKSAALFFVVLGIIIGGSFGVTWVSGDSFGTDNFLGINQGHDSTVKQ